MDFVDYSNVVWIDHSNIMINMKVKETVKKMLSTMHLCLTTEDRWIAEFLESMEYTPTSATSTTPSVLISPLIS